MLGFHLFTLNKYHFSFGYFNWFILFTCKNILVFCFIVFYFLFNHNKNYHNKLYNVLELEYIGYKMSLQNSRNMHTYKYSDKCVRIWVRIQVDIHIRINYKKGNAEGKGG